MMCPHHGQMFAHGCVYCADAVRRQQAAYAQRAHAAQMAAVRPAEPRDITAEIKVTFEEAKK